MLVRPVLGIRILVANAMIIILLENLLINVLVNLDSMSLILFRFSVLPVKCILNF